MEMDHRDSDLEGSVCSPDFISRRMYETPLRSNAELSDPELGDEDSNDPSSRRQSDPAPEQDVLVKLKRERDDQDDTVQREMKPSPLPPLPSGSSPIVPQPTFSLPLPFPFPHPGAAFLPPAPQYTTTTVHAPTTVHHAASSGSSHSSESSSSSQSQQTWSFEEQFKQVRQLYEISDDPKRKEFLDDLFSYMQRRGTPINRLPIMAKSVLDLYELYNLVIQRGGLVDVINKKLWQEIIKGLHLPSSITSAAFTLRTQYMKYLYPYECEKRRLSTPGELQAAIDGNRREGRRGSYGTYAEMMQRSPSQMSPLSLVTGARPQVNGNAGNHHHANNNHLPHHQALLPPSIPGKLQMLLAARNSFLSPGTSIPPNEFEARMVEYVKLLNKEMRNTGTPPNHRQATPPSSPQESVLSAFDMSRLTLWNLYHNQTSPPEPQKEPINLEKREDPVAGPPPKRHQSEGNEEVKMTGAHIKISSRNDGRGGTDNSLVVSMDINGTMYQGVLFAQSSRNNRIQSSS